MKDLEINYLINEVYYEMRKHPNSNDIDVCRLKPYAKRISCIEIPEINQNSLDADRLKWLKYWTARAVNLYGDKAGIMFR